VLLQAPAMVPFFFPIQSNILSIFFIGGSPYAAFEYIAKNPIGDETCTTTITFFLHNSINFLLKKVLLTGQMIWSAILLINVRSVTMTILDVKL
jgi:hypothetical protein